MAAQAGSEVEMPSHSTDSPIRQDLRLAMLPPRAVYALRAMAVLANLAPGESISGQLLAEQGSIPGAFVSKVMRRLVQGGLVASQRGHGGGFRMAVPPATVNFRAVLESVGFALDSTRCVFGLRACDETAPCALHRTWSDLRDALSEWADASTLAHRR